jgi:hypothetical protein
MNWLPIESHPKGHKMFAVIGKDVNIKPGKMDGVHYTTDPYYVFWREKEGFVRWPHPFPPTHWHPMPEFN